MPPVGFRHLLSRCKTGFCKWHKEINSTEYGRKSYKLMIIGAITLPFMVMSVQRVPLGYVGVVRNCFGNYKTSLYDDYHLFFIVPFFEECIHLRAEPVRKRLIQEFTTKDGRIIELVALLRLKAKIYYGQDIIHRMGPDFGRTFLEQEVSLDAENIVSQHTYNELLHDEETNDKPIATELITRVREAACFCRLHLLDMTIMFRDPLDGEA